MTLDLIRTLYDYNYWAHHLVWECVLRLTQEEFERSLNYSWGSVHAQVVHAMSNEWMWFRRLRGESPQSLHKTSDFRTPLAVQTKWEQTERDVRDYINNLTESELHGTFTFYSASGSRYIQRVDETLMHVVLSGVDNRAQTLAMLNELGAPTVEQDMIYYLRERNEVAR